MTDPETAANSAWGAAAVLVWGKALKRQASVAAFIRPDTLMVRFIPIFLVGKAFDPGIRIFTQAASVNRNGALPRT
jgi:hypothetical protein